MLFSKHERIDHNGMDCLMTAFDYQMKQHGFAGNQAQMVVGLPEAVDAGVIADRVAELVKTIPVLTARSKRHFFSRIPCWEIGKKGFGPYPKVVSHFLKGGADILSAHAALQKKLFNIPLETQKGEQVRFDLVYFPGGEMEIYLTWGHALMDAHGGEYLFVMLGNPGLEKEYQTASVGRHPEGKARSADNGKQWEKVRQAFDYIDRIALHPPVSLYSRFAERWRPVQFYRIMRFSRSETSVILGNARKTCGLFNESTYFAACLMCELLNLYQAMDVAADHYILSLPVNLRKKGTHFPILSNQSTTLLYSFSRETLRDISTAARLFKKQTQAAIRSGLLEANVALMEISRILPPWFYMKKVTKAMKGEIASVVFANPGTVHPGFEQFLDQPVQYVYHMPTIVTPPGIGALFYQFAGQLALTFVYTEGLLADSEVARFQDGVCENLLKGSMDS